MRRIIAWTLTLAIMIQPVFGVGIPKGLEASQQAMMNTVKMLTQEITILIDQQKVRFDSEYGLPDIIEGRVMVPARAISAALGFSVRWDDNTKSVVVNKSGVSVVLPVKEPVNGIYTYYVNGAMKTADTGPVINNGRTYIPLRLVSAAFGLSVDWDPVKRVVSILTNSLEVKPSNGAGLVVAPDELTVTALNVGQADSIFLDYGDTEILIDGGNGADGDLISQYIKSRVSGDLELVIATHPDEDHIGGLPEILGAFDVERIIHSGKTGVTSSGQITRCYLDYKTALEKESALGCEVIEDSDMVLDYGDLKVRIIETGDDWDNDNDSSVITEVTFQESCFLFMGDAGFEVEKKLLNSGLKTGGYLKVGHHGSKYSSGSEFLEMLRPSYSVISVSKDNNYGHPAPETLKRLTDVGSVLYTTIGGNVTVTTDGNGYMITN